MSEIRVNNIKNEAGTGAPTFPNGVQVTGVSTLGNTVVGGGTTQLVVTGNARITGILTIGTSSITLDGSSNQVNVGTGVTLHHTNGVQVGGNTLHSTVLTVNNINASGVVTATSFSGSGANLTGIGGTTDVRTNSLVVSGVSTFAGITTNTSTLFANQLSVSGVSTFTTVKVNNIQSTSANSAISIASDGTSTITKLDIPYLSVTRSGYTVSAGFSDITWENIIASKYITATASSANIQFSYPGKYRISVGWRFGAAADVWTGVRLLDGSTTRGVGYGTGNIANDPGPCEIGFLATIPSDRVNTNMTVQFYRDTSTMAIANPGAGLSGLAPAIVCIIQYLGV